MISGLPYDLRSGYSFYLFCRNPLLLMKFNQQKSNKLATYLTAGLGAGCLAGQADAAITVMLYGPGTKSPSTTPAAPAGFNVGVTFSGQRCIIGNYLIATAAFTGSGPTGTYFTNGSDLGVVSNFGYGQYTVAGLASVGTTFNSDQNFANISFNGPDGVYEGVAQFYLDGNGGGYLVATAINDTQTPLTISAGKAAIMAAVPEPSGLALLALGAGGLLARRKRAVA